MSAKPVQITWVNHASFVYAHGSVRLICDPWLSGAAFNNGWRHIADTVFRPSDFHDVTHVWISHQHPDHFAPADLRRIDAADRARLTVFYQPVPDRLVVSWLRSAGFKNVVELQLGRWTPLGDGTEIMCGAHNDDSWLAIRSGDATLLNVNDCVLKRAEDVRAIAQRVGTVDVLFTQFSYAQWVGNPQDAERRRHDAAEKLERIRLQCRIFEPRIVIPFASFVYFSNSENFFMNDGMNRVVRVAEFIENELGKQAVVLYPGATWTLGETHDWRPAAYRYQADAERRLAAGPADRPRELPQASVEQYARDFLKRLHRKNPAARWLMREKTTFYLTDMDCGYELNAGALRRLELPRTQADVVTAAENLMYAFRMPWGGNTLHVSGRFESYVPGAHLRFFRFMQDLHYYNRTVIDTGWLKDQCRRMLLGGIRRIKRLAAG